MQKLNKATSSFRIYALICLTDRVCSKHCLRWNRHTRANDSAPIQPPPLRASTTDDPNSWVVELWNNAAEVINTTTIQDPAITQYLFSGLMKGTRYGARVAGINDMGVGAFSIIINITTSVDRELYVCVPLCL